MQLALQDVMLACILLALAASSDDDVRRARTQRVRLSTAEQMARDQALIEQARLDVAPPSPDPATGLPYGDETARQQRHQYLVNIVEHREALLQQGRAFVASHQMPQQAPPKGTRTLTSRPHAPHERVLQSGGTSTVSPPPAPPMAPDPPSQPPSSPPTEIAEEHSALIALYEACGGPTWSQANNWLSGPPCSDPVWQGVVCSFAPLDAPPSPPHTPGQEFPPPLPPAPTSPPPPPPHSPGASGADFQRVQRVELTGNNLIGTLPSALGKLLQLVSLSLGDNQLSGYLPPSISRLRVLEELVLTSNRVSGVLADAVLTGIDTSADSPFGGAPREPAWPEVTHVLLTENPLSGTIPPAVSAFTKLRRLHASRTSLAGTLPSALFTSAHALEDLQIENTRLSGTLPSELGSLKMATHLLLDRGAISGTIPTQLGRPADLLILSLEFNQLSGTIPLELGGNCSRANSFELGPLTREPFPVPDTDLRIERSDPNDGPRGLQHPSTPPEARRTAALLRMRGNWDLRVGERDGLPVDLPDLSSHDLCAYAQGPLEVRVNEGWPTSAEAGFTATLDGTMFRSPSPRAVPPDAESVPWEDPYIDRSGPLLS